MSLISKPTYLIAELEGDVEPLVLGMRRQFNPGHEKWPVDISLAGSSGIGTVKEGQDLKAVIRLLAPIIEKHAFAELEFLGTSRFPGTGIYFLAPARPAFDAIHHAVAASGVEFNPNQWPFNPHCTLRVGPSASEEVDLLLHSIQLPSLSHVGCFSLYQPAQYGGERLYRF